MVLVSEQEVWFKSHKLKTITFDEETQASISATISPLKYPKLINCLDQQTHTHQSENLIVM